MVPLEKKRKLKLRKAFFDFKDSTDQKENII